LELFVETIGLVGEDRQPLLNGIKKLVKDTTSKENHGKEENKP
ncbi:MAG: undecaprenyl/decaprenyl-phosphate alpha-N-acetylglucosaminyl 1-phosphate transferase, partial [Lentilactobacillus hilgardii]